MAGTWAERARSPCLPEPSLHGLSGKPSEGSTQGPQTTEDSGTRVGDELCPCLACRADQLRVRGPEHRGQSRPTKEQTEHPSPTYWRVSYVKSLFPRPAASLSSVSGKREAGTEGRPANWHCPTSLLSDLPWPLPALPNFPLPSPRLPHLRCAGFLLGQLLQLRPLLPEGVQHLLVADHLLDVPLVTCIGVGGSQSSTAGARESGGPA